MTSVKVYGKVLGKPRPRVNRNGRVWTPKKFKDYEKKIANAYIDAGGELLKGEVSVTVATYRELPKSRPKKVESEPDNFKPDVDNIGKIFLDALNGVAYEDDKQVTILCVTKMPRAMREEFATVTVEPITNSLRGDRTQVPPTGSSGACDE